MAWPPSPLPINRVNTTQMPDTHPGDHNAHAQAINDIVTYVQTIPIGGGGGGGGGVGADAIIAHTTSASKWQTAADYIMGVGSSNTDVTNVNNILASIGTGGEGGYVIFAPTESALYDFGPGGTALTIPANVRVEFLDSDGKNATVSGFSAYTNMVAQFESGIIFSSRSSLILGAGTFGIGSSANATAKITIGSGISGVSILGKSPGQTTLVRHTSVTAANGLIDNTGNSATNKNLYFIMRDIQLDGQNTAFPLTNLNHISYFQFQNVTYANNVVGGNPSTGAGLYINDADNCVVMNCKFFNCGTLNGSPVKGSINIYTDGTNKSHDIYFMNTNIDNPSDTGISIVGTSTVMHNRIHFHNVRLEDHETGNNPSIKLDFVAGASFRDISMIIGENSPGTAISATDQFAMTNSKNILLDNIYCEAVNTTQTGLVSDSTAHASDQYSLQTSGSGNINWGASFPTSQFVNWQFIVPTGANANPHPISAYSQVSSTTRITINADIGTTPTGKAWFAYCQNIGNWINIGTGNSYITVKNVQGVASSFHYATALIGFSGTNHNYIELNNGSYITDNSGLTDGACIRKTNPTPTPGSWGIVCINRDKTLVAQNSPPFMIFGADYVCPPEGTIAAPDDGVRNVIQKAIDDCLGQPSSSQNPNPNPTYSYQSYGSKRIPLRVVQGDYNITTSGDGTNGEARRNQVLEMNIGNAGSSGDVHLYGDGRLRSNINVICLMPLDAYGNPRYILNVWNGNKDNSLILHDISFSGPNATNPLGLKDSTGAVATTSLQSPDDDPIPNTYGYGVRVVNRCEYFRVGIYDCYAGLVLDGISMDGTVSVPTDHTLCSNFNISHCRHGLFITRNSGVTGNGQTTAADNVWDTIKCGQNQKAAFTCSTSGRFIQSTFRDCHGANTPYGFLKQGTWGVIPFQPTFMDGCQFVRTKCEGSGNWAVYDESGLAQILNCQGWLLFDQIEVNGGGHGTNVNPANNHSAQFMTGAAVRTVTTGVVTFTGVRINTTNPTGGGTAAHGACTRNYTGNMTAGNATITAVSPNPTDIVNGTQIFGLNISQQLGAIVTVASTTSTTITLSSAPAALTTKTGISFSVGKGVAVGDLISMCPVSFTGNGTATEKSFVTAGVVTAITGEDSFTCIQQDLNITAGSSTNLKMATCGALAMGALLSNSLSITTSKDPTTNAISADTFWNLDAVAGNEFSFPDGPFPSVSMRGMSQVTQNGGVITRTMNTLGKSGNIICTLRHVTGTNIVVGQVCEFGTNGGAAASSGISIRGLCGVARTSGALTTAPAFTTVQAGGSSVIQPLNIYRPFIWIQSKGPFYANDNNTANIDINNGVLCVSGAAANAIMVMDSSGGGRTSAWDGATGGLPIVGVSYTVESGGFIGMEVNV